MEHPIASPARSRAGSMLIEIGLILVVLGVLAVMAVPRYQQAAERGRAAEAFSALSRVGIAQKMYQSEHGVFAASLDELKLHLPESTVFALGEMEVSDDGQAWSLTARRIGELSSYGAYELRWGADGFQRSQSSVADKLIPTLIAQK